MFLLVLWSVPAFAQAPAKTVIHDAVEAELLLGKHLFTSLGLERDLHYTRYGESVIYKKDGVYYMYAGQIRFHETREEPYRGGGYIIAKGTITEIKHKEFVFEGVIETQTLQGHEWYPCVRTGRFMFSRDHDDETQYEHDVDFWRYNNGSEDYKRCDPRSDYLGIDMYVDDILHVYNFTDP
ncbi:MAG: hypothetical protein KDJ35_07750 [Alphaproteobacteria bacterium]|nr:hypothetical protein [Alphaproteobacteria bacterium]